MINDKNDNNKVELHLVKDLIISLFGASTAAAAALVAAAAAAAAQTPSVISAIVSRGGRSDLAGKDTLNKVQVRTLLLVGGHDDPQVLQLNENALKEIKAEEEEKLTVVPGATHI